MVQIYPETLEIRNKISADTVLFFDMDGTLIDTNLANFLSYKQAILSVTKSDFNLSYDSENRFTRSSIHNIFPNMTETEIEIIAQEKEKYYRDFLMHTTVNTAVVDILSKYSKTNRTVLVTNCREERAIMTLKYHGLFDKFTDFIFKISSQPSNNNDKINKFQYAIQSMRISPRLVVVFENDKSEIKEALNAGILINNIVYF